MSSSSKRRPSRISAHSPAADATRRPSLHRLSSPTSTAPPREGHLSETPSRRPSLEQRPLEVSKQRHHSAPDLLKGLARPASATNASRRRASLSEALDEAQHFLRGQLQQGRWRPGSAVAERPHRRRSSKSAVPESIFAAPAVASKMEDPPPFPVLLQTMADDNGFLSADKSADRTAAPPSPEPSAPVAVDPLPPAPLARQCSRLSDATAVQLDDQHHKDFATVWSSVWFRTQVKHDAKPPSGAAWAEGSLQKGILQRLSYKMSKMPKDHLRGHERRSDPGKALQLVVAPSGLMPVWLPESLDVEDEEDLSDALLPVTGTVFRHWCHARESEVRVDDLVLVLGDLGIEAVQEILEHSLAGNIYATLDWPDFVSVLKDYRRFERQHHRKIFERMSSAGSVSMEDLETLLENLGQPAALQALEKCDRKSSTMNFAKFEEFLRQLRLTEGFSQHDLRELQAFFEVEKTTEQLRKEPLCRCSLPKVQQVMMLRGFPTTEEEVEKMAEKLCYGEVVSFRQMLRLIRCLKELERTQALEIIQRYSQERRNAIQVADLPLALGGLGYYPDEDAIAEHLTALGPREAEDCLTPEELAKFLQKYRQVSGFTREQYHNLAQSFAKADKTKRGQLNALELTEVLRRAGFHVSMQDVIQALHHFDLEGIGLLSLPEVLKLLRGLLAKEAELRRNAFLSACRGPAQKLPARDLAETIARVRGYQPDKTVLSSMLSILGLHSMGLRFTAFEHVCKLMRESDVKFMQRNSGYTPEQVAELKVHYQTYDPEDQGHIPGANLPKLFLDAFPLYSTCARQQMITKTFMEEVSQSSSRWTFETFLSFVRLAEDEACFQDLVEEEQLVAEKLVTAEECRGFREIFISKADHNCAVTDEEILDMFDFATAEFNQDQRSKFFQVMKEVDRHYYGSALRFPDFLRFMKRLTEKPTEADLGLVRASLRLEEAEVWAKSWRAKNQSQRGMSRAGSLFFKTELEIQRIKSQSSRGSSST